MRLPLPTLAAFAPAKVNLFLHVGGPDAEGYHPISSLMVFADVGDQVAIQPSDAPAFETTGPFGGAIPGDGDNLVVRAARALDARLGGPVPPYRLVLDKRLPIAAGLGGGSSDAGARPEAAARPLGPWSFPMTSLSRWPPAWARTARPRLRARALMAEGRGEILSSAPALPELNAVLVNPGAPSPTGAVYRAYDAAAHPDGAERPFLPSDLESAEEVAAWLTVATRNDLEAPAVALEPRIGEVCWTSCARSPKVCWSGCRASGATCPLFRAGDIEAETPAERLETMRPDWWVRRCRLS
ncbi:4-(cytidine 5'-diphospho)-2-C-methyl-D-erythritol kinase [Caulobacter segnis]